MLHCGCRPLSDGLCLLVGIQPLWPFSQFELRCSILEYLDLIVLGIWLLTAVALYLRNSDGVQIATLSLMSFTAYILLRAYLPPPEDVFRLVAGGWMYAARQGTPVLDRW